MLFFFGACVLSYYGTQSLSISEDQKWPRHVIMCTRLGIKLLKARTNFNFNQEYVATVGDTAICILENLGPERRVPVSHTPLIILKNILEGGSQYPINYFEKYLISFKKYGIYSQNSESIGSSYP